MTYLRRVEVTAQDSPSVDAFGRWRTSHLDTVFDSKQIHDAQPFFWDDQETSGSGTGSAHSTSAAQVVMSVGNTTAGTRVRQTFQRWPYQPGKSQLVAMTFGTFNASTGITKRVGYFDANNGIFLQNAAGTVSLVVRSRSSGSLVNTAVAQASWNIDQFDGTGPSGVTIDWTKCQIMIIDFQWLGVGRIRIGFDVDGIFYAAHEFLHANSVSVVYMSTPNLPLRYEVSNDGTGAAATFQHICASIGNEGTGRRGVELAYRTGSIANLAANTEYLVAAMKLKTTHLDSRVILERIGIASSTANEIAAWSLVWNPTIGGSPSYSDVTNASVQTAPGTGTTNTITGGTRLANGYFTTATPVTSALPNELNLGSNIAGTPDVIALTCTPVTNNITVRGSLTWKEEE